MAALTDSTPMGSDDFAAYRASGEPAGTGLMIGRWFCLARDAVARFLLRRGFSPDQMTVAGALVMLGAGVCLAVGAGHRAPWAFGLPGLPDSFWPLAAAACIFAAAAMDMVDGAMSRLGNAATAFGGILDSITDRFSDIFIFLGCAIFFARAGNVTCVVLAIAGLSNAVLISYVKARAECVIEDCGVGYWLRGERVAAALLAALFGHMPAFLCQQAIFPAFTVWRRIGYARRVCHSMRRNLPMPDKGPHVGWRRYVALWRFPRGSLQYDIVTAANIAFLLAGPWVFPFLYGRSDPLGRALNAWL